MLTFVYLCTISILGGQLHIYVNVKKPDFFCVRVYTMEFRVVCSDTKLLVSSVLSRVFHIVTSR